MIHQLRTFPNLLTLLRLVIIPFVVLNILEQDYRLALVLFVLAGLSDGLDGVLARALKQKTVLGQYLDPIADKLLLSTLFLVLSLLHKIPWKVTVLVFSRDIIILIVCAVLWATTSMRDFRPSIFGKLNTVAQVATLFLVLLREVMPRHAVAVATEIGLWTTLALTLISGLHYVVWTGQRLRAHEGQKPASAG